MSPDPSPRLQWDGSGYARLRSIVHKIMKLEWRVFWPAYQGQPNVFYLLKTQHPLSQPARTDVYYAITKDVGIKFKKLEVFEVKIKRGRDENGIEEWEKAGTC